MLKAIKKERTRPPENTEQSIKQRISILKDSSKELAQNTVQRER